MFDMYRLLVGRIHVQFPADVFIRLKERSNLNADVFLAFCTSTCKHFQAGLMAWNQPLLTSSWNLKTLPFFLKQFENI